MTKALEDEDQSAAYILLVVSFKSGEQMVKPDVSPFDVLWLTT
jgi:hypothetical protein